MNRFKSIGIIKNEFKNYDKLICLFKEKINTLSQTIFGQKMKLLKFI